MQYTIRGIPDDVDRAAREAAKREGISLNQVLVRALRVALGLEPSTEQKRDLSDVAGQCSIDDDARAFFDEQRKIDQEVWERSGD